MRQALQRVAASIREYDLLQTNRIQALGIIQTKLPSELLDALSHDPAAVTGSTRSLKGWRAVEDIHGRVMRQRDTCRSFLALSQDAIPPSGSVFDDSINKLSQTLHELEDHKAAIATKARDVAGILTRVKGIHASVKTEYNETFSHTSVVYPEVRVIISLSVLARELSFGICIVIANYCAGRKL